MNRSNRSLFTYVFVGITIAIACAPQEPEVAGGDDEDNNDGGTGTGATSGFGGSFGGAVPSGGGTYPTTGGTPPTGGSFTGGTAGVVSTGGFAGVQAMGGSFPTTGGTVGVSGAAPTGGVAGTVATGGASGAATTGGAGGGASVSCDAAFSVGVDGFVRAPGTSGCWHGYASAGGDTGTMVMPTSFAMCGMNCMLRVTGTVGPATAANMYAGVMYMGFNVNQATGSTTAGTIAPTGTSLAVTFTKTSGPATIRVQLAAGSTRWCAALTTSPATIPYTMFNTACWDNSGTAYAKQPIDTVQLVIPGADAAAAFDVTLVSVKDT